MVSNVSIKAKKELADMEITRLARENSEANRVGVHVAKYVRFRTHPSQLAKTQLKSHTEGLKRVLGGKPRKI